MPQVSIVRTPPEFIDLRCAVQRYCMSKRTLRRLIARGLPIYRTGPAGKILIRPGDLTNFLLRQQAPQPDLNGMVESTFKELAR